MSKLFLAFIFLFAAHAQSAPAPTKPVLISGFDDVLRQAENTGLIKAALKILEEDKTFAGMPELYQVITSQETTPVKFTLVSGISTWFESRIEKFLTSERYPTSRRYLRNWLTDWSIEDFKVEKLEIIVNANPNRKFIAIFDNSEPSFQIADIINKKYSDKISPVYLREVVAREGRPHTTYFITPMDIAVRENFLTRLTASDVHKVATALLAEQNPDRIVPRYAYCPKDYNPCKDATDEVKADCAAVRTKVTEICKTR